MIALSERMLCSTKYSCKLAEKKKAKLKNLIKKAMKERLYPYLKNLVKKVVKPAVRKFMRKYNLKLKKCAKDKKCILKTLKNLAKTGYLSMNDLIKLRKKWTNFRGIFMPALEYKYVYSRLDPKTKYALILYRKNRKAWSYKLEKKKSNKFGKHFMTMRWFYLKSVANFKSKTFLKKLYNLLNPLKKRMLCTSSYRCGIYESNIIGTRSYLKRSSLRELKKC